MMRLFRILFNLERDEATADTATRKDNIILFLVLLSASVITFLTGMWFLTVFTTVGFIYVGGGLLFSKPKTL